MPSAVVMPHGLRKFALVAHVTSSVGLLGAVAAFLALAVAGLTGQDARSMQVAYVAMEMTTWYVVVPLNLAALLTGLVQSLGTSWGLFRHYWVVVKLLLTTLITVVLLLQTPQIAYMADRATGMRLSGTDHLGLRASLVVHAGGGLLVLLVTTTLSIYKPRGLTRYGWRRRHEQRSEADH
jgi:hypothetical protein